jgi:hypothetical protein
MSRQPRLLGDLFHRIVWMLAVPVAGCGSSVTQAQGSDAGADVQGPIDRPPPTDVPVADAGPADVGVDTGQPDAGDCAPFPDPLSTGSCEDLVVYPCGLPPEAQVDAGGFLPSDLCDRLCRPLGAVFNGGCRRASPRADGAEQIACTTCAIGRRTEGLGSVEGARECGPLGDFFARVATLEWASVTAFERLAGELEAIGAPGELVAGARASAEDERRHTRSMGALAERFGAPVRAPSFAPARRRSLEAIALENAAEGCVRETFGALVATWQARAAGDAAVAAALREVAADETRHAEFSWALQRWVDGVLDDGARARVRAARVAAEEELRAELDAAVDPALVAVAGMPDRATARSLFASMTAALA